MKKTTYWLISFTLLLMLALSACQSAGSTPLPGGGEVPENTAVPTPEPTSASIVSEGLGACKNDFYPLRADTVWTYQIIDAGNTKQGSFTLTYQNIGEDTFDALMSLRDPDTDEILQVRGTWYCSGEGILNSDFSTLEFAPGLHVQAETLNYDGITLLPDDQWEPGATWDSSYQLNVTFSVEDVDVTSAMDVDLTSTITGIESVSVAAGSYPEAYRVETSGAMKLNMEGDMSFSMSDIPIDFTIWYVRDVGMVKQTTSEPDGSETVTELVSIE